jgi:NAD(P)-dependent dehydrogenase (short-subunit alcohol dehydrogenase family)
MMSRFRSGLSGKAGILTGGSSGFGYEMVRLIVAQGGRVASFSIDQVDAQARRQAEAAGPGEVVFYEKDIMATNAADEMVDQTMRQFGRLDFVIANAGFAIRFEKPLLETSTEELAEAMRTQFEVFPIAFATLAIRASQVMAPVYSAIQPDETGHRPDSGAILATLSLAAIIPLRDDLLAYSAAKRAGVSIVESLAATLGPYNIRVNAIAPGFANTAGPKKFYDRYANIREDIDDHTHLQPSFLHPGAVLPAVEYLLTDNFITGQVITMDGGYHIGLRRYFQGTATHV